MVEIWLPLPRFVPNVFLPTPAADPSLRGWEGGISGRGGVSDSVSSGAGARRNREAKSALRDTTLTTKVIVWVTRKLTKSTINLLVRLMVTLHVGSINVDYVVCRSLPSCVRFRARVGRSIEFFKYGFEFQS